MCVFFFSVLLAVLFFFFFLLHKQEILIMPLFKRMADPSSTSPSFFIHGWQNKYERSPLDRSLGSVSRHVQTQSWHSDELEPEEEAAALQGCATPMAASQVSRQECKYDMSYSPPWYGAVLQPHAAAASSAVNNSGSVEHARHVGLCAGAPATPPTRLSSPAAVTAAVTTVDGDDMDSVVDSLRGDGADARYVEVANERAFSALQVRSGDTSNTATPVGLHIPGYSRAGRGSPLTGPQTYYLGEERTTAATLTPVRTPLTGTTSVQQLHTPLHSTGYGSNCYNRLLFNALLGESEGRVGVFSFPARSTPLSATQHTGLCAAPIDATGTKAATTERAAEEGERVGVSARDRMQGSLAEGPVTGSASPPYTKQSDDADNVPASSSSSPHPPTLYDSKAEEEEGGNEDRSEAALRHVRLSSTSGQHQQQQQWQHQRQAQEQPGDVRGHDAWSSSGRTPTVTLPVSYFQHAPPVWSGGNPPAVRLCLEEGGKSDPNFGGANDASSSTHAWPGPLVRPGLPLRTDGVVPHTFFSFSPPTLAGPRGSQGAELSPHFSAVVAAPNATAASASCDTPLSVPSELMRQTADMVNGSYTPPSLHLRSAEAVQGERGAPSHVDADADDAVPSFPLFLHSSMPRSSIFNTPVTYCSTCALPASTARAAYLAVNDGSRRGDALPSRQLLFSGSCATPVPASSTDSPVVWRSRQETEDRDAEHHASTTSHSLFPMPSTFGEGRGEASRGRPLTASHAVSTPVRHHDNLLRGFANNRYSSGPQSASPVPPSPVSHFPVSPVGIMTPVSLSPARQTLRYGAAAAAATRTDGLLHLSPYRDSFLGPAARTSTTTGVAAHAAAAAAASAAHRRGCTSRRDAFRFMRALTANETSTSFLRSPFFWGCFGILVAQGLEVWCVGKGQPFRIFPHDTDRAARVRDNDAAVTAVASTTVLSLETWEEAATVADDASIASSSSATAVVSAMEDLVYLAVGTSAGDVTVYAYGKCSTVTPGAVLVSPCSPHLSSSQQHQTSTYAVKLQHYGTLKFTDRIGSCARADGEESDCHHSSTLHGRTPSAQSSGSGDDQQRHAISVIRIVGPWMYVSDQSGHVSRYDLRHTAFLHRMHESAAAAATTTTTRQVSTRLPSPTGTARRLRPAGGGASTPARVTASPDPRMPVHHFGRPRATPSAHGTTTGATAPRSASTSSQQTTSPSSALSSSSSSSSSFFHFAVHTGEPVYNLEVTDNHSYLAVGTQTRLLVYRVAEMPRVMDGNAAASAVPLPAAHPRQNYAASTPLPEATPSDAVPHTMLDVAVEAAAPLVVVSDAVQPVRCFAWMLCDYETLASARGDQCWREDSQATADGEALEHGDAGDRVGGVGLRAFGRCSPSSPFAHTPTPSLVFATACEEAAGVAGGAAEAESEENGCATPCCKTVIRLLRVVTQSVVASCTLDYPVRVLRAVAGTTQIIVGTGSTAEWQRHSTPASRVRMPVMSPSPRRSSQSRFMTPMSLPPPAQPTHTLSQSVNTSTPVTAASALSPTFPRSPALTSLRRRSTPTLAVMTALRILTGDEGSSSAGLWQSPQLTSAGPAAVRLPTRIGNSSMRPSSAGSGGHRSGTFPMLNRGAHATTPDDSSAAHQLRAEVTGGREHGFLFMFEVCPWEADGMAGGDDRGGCVCLRCRGETIIGEGECAVSGYVSPAQDQVSVLVQPSTSHPHRTGGVSHALSVKVKVWSLTAGSRGGPPGSVARHPLVPCMTSSSSVVSTVESLR